MSAPDSNAASRPDPGRFARLTALNALATLTVPLASLVDTAMLGHLPVETALAGASLGALVFDYLFWSFGFLRMGTTGLAAGAVGRGDDEEVRALLWRAAVIGAVLGVLVLGLRPLLVWIAGAALPGEMEVVGQAQHYVAARILGAPATLCNFAITGWLIGTGRSGRALVLASVANIGNALLNVVFIWMMGLEAAGAGYATACGQWLALVVVVATLTGQVGARPARERVFDRARLRELFSLGGDITIRTICLVTAMSLFTGAGALWGSAALAGQAVLMRVSGLFAYVIDGAAHAVETMAGQAHAAGRNDDATTVLRWGYRVSAVVSLGLGGILLAAPGATVGLLTDIDPVLEHATRWLPWVVVIAFVGGFAYVLDGLFIGIAAGRALRNAMLLSFTAGFVPLFLAALYFRSLPLLWSALLLFMLLRSATLAYAWHAELVRPEKKAESTEE